MLSFLNKMIGLDGDDVSRRSQIDDKRVKSYVARLLSAGTDRAQFDRVLSDLKAKDLVPAADLKAIAQGYAGGGRVPATRSAAFAALTTRFTELVRTRKNMSTAAKERLL